MTSPPDVQNIPDIWGAAEAMLDKAEARVKELEQLATPAVVDTFFGLNNRALRAEKALDIAEARMRELQADLVCAFDAIGTAGVDGPLNLIDAAKELREERDALRARLEAIRKMPSYVLTRHDCESEDFTPDLIERPELP